MKTTISIVFLTVILAAASCSKENESEKFRLLTSHAWTTDSLVAKSNDAAAQAVFQQNLEKFRGDAEFRKDGTGTFGNYEGEWRFSSNENNLVIESDSLDLPLTTNIVELTSSSLKVTTLFPNILHPESPVNIRMTFKSK